MDEKQLYLKLEEPRFCEACNHTGWTYSSIGGPDSPCLCNPDAFGANVQPYAQSCFIATAVYGDVHAPEVETLRRFRDGVLMQTDLGRTLCRAYYSGLGQQAAHMLEYSVPRAIPLVRKGLDWFVRNSS